MPIPSPRKNEPKDKFISRCMGNSNAQEFPQAQRYAVCLSKWNRRKKTNQFGNDVITKKK